MLLVTHIVIALANLFLAGYGMLRPSRRLLQGVALGSGLTVVSGTALALQTHAALASACLSGLLYTGAILLTVAVARYRLSKVTARI